ncbi:MAG: ferrochelatase [Kangiellaceae bacterium]|nr:ferrochelatase [Kangiellaceae bacterium]MCW9016685.1 ferrochelatase [Kangiellaceae bacterium]
MSQPKIGVLLVNLGTPAEPTPSSVRQFLKEFLSDKRVIDLPRIVWLPILYGIILTFRPKKVAKNYQKIWTENGSPLLNFSVKQQQKLQALFEQNVESEISDGELPNATFKVSLGMTYGMPSIQSGLDELAEWGADKVVVLPLYPQFSHTTTSSVKDQIDKLESNYGFQLQFINDYHDNAQYIEALKESVASKLGQGKELQVDKLILSLHGIPKRYVSNGDPYQSQCEATAKLLAQELGLQQNQWELCYQSRVGKEEWLTPYLDLRMEQLSAEGVKKIAVLCPGFSVDCLETLEEIAMENKDIFLQNGGESFDYIAALNDTDPHIQMMASLIKQSL